MIQNQLINYNKNIKIKKINEKSEENKHYENKFKFLKTPKINNKNSD